MQSARSAHDVIELPGFLASRLRIREPGVLFRVGLENTKTPDFQLRLSELNLHVGPRENGTAIRRES